MNIKNYILAFTIFSTTSLVYAKEEKIQHDAHEHGVAELNIVWEKDELNIELLSPAFNITGFENQPKNHDQEEIVAKIEKKLNTPKELFTFKNASCKVVKIDVDSPFAEGSDHKDHDDHKEHDDHKDHDDHKEHDDHKDHDDHKEHDDHKDHDHGEDSSSTHSEYSISYEFSCTNSKTELTIETANLFKHFPQMEKIKVQWLSTTQQSLSILTKKDNSITLK